MLSSGCGLERHGPRPRHHDRDGGTLAFTAGVWAKFAASLL
jgi:hypothetical protein